MSGRLASHQVPQWERPGWRGGREGGQAHYDGAGDASRSQTAVGLGGHIRYVCLYHESSGLFEGF